MLAGQKEQKIQSRRNTNGGCKRLREPNVTFLAYLSPSHWRFRCRSPRCPQRFSAARLGGRAVFVRHSCLLLRGRAWRACSAERQGPKMLQQRPLIRPTDGRRGVSTRDGIPHSGSPSGERYGERQEAVSGWTFSCRPRGGFGQRTRLHGIASLLTPTLHFHKISCL